MKSIKEIFRSWGVVDEQGRHINGSDKETNHSYGDAYEKLFIPKDIITTDLYWSNRKNIRLMMEVGIADGSSLRAWSEIFPNAICVGLDVHHADKAHGDRIEFYKGNQRIKEDCERAANNRLFDFIVEDAAHTIDNTLLTLYWLWPYMKPGGIYVVEEWSNILGDYSRIKTLFPTVEIVGTCGPYMRDEPLVVFRKPM